MSRNRILIFICIILIIIALFVVKQRIQWTKNKFRNEFFNIKIKSGNLTTDYNINKALEDIEKFQLNTINLPIVIKIENLSSSNMKIDKNSMERAIELIKILKKDNINIILEPYPWIANGSEYETNWNPDNINDFFWNWKENVLKVLIHEIAIPYDVDVLSIGTSFNHMEYAEGYWLNLIDYIRQDYSGLITYRTSWWITAHWDESTLELYEEKTNNKLFSKLDFISLASYFELTDNDTNTVENLVVALESTEIFDRRQNVKEELKTFYEKWDKPIFFGELGFPRTIKASIHPWDPFQSDIIDDQEQANCFEAYRQVFQDESWLMGFSIFAIGEDSEDKLYYPSQQSTEVIKNWYVSPLR